MRILHMLNWNLNDIVTRLPLVKNQGFDAIQINPMQPCKDDLHKQWWLSYQPIGFRVGNEFGSKEDLTRLCRVAQLFGIDIIVDVICNHTGNLDHGDPLSPNEKVDKEILPEYFKKPTYQIQNWDNRFEVTDGCIGLPKLDLTNDNLQKLIFRYLTDLKKCGVRGFRFDAAKHIALPSEGCTFWQNVKDFLESNNLYAYAEILSPTLDISDEYSKYLNVLTQQDSPVRNNECKVTWVESHDDYLNNINGPHLNDEALSQMYNELTRENINTLYYMRPWDNFALESESIKKANHNTVNMGFAKTYRK